MNLTIEDRNWLLEALKKQQFFSVCSITEIKEIISLVTKKDYELNETIIKEGATGDLFFIIGKGKVSVYINSGKGKPEKFSSLSEGDYFGEIALITGQARNATVVTDEPCILFLIFRNDFIGLLAKNPSLEIKILKMIEQRLDERKIFLSEHEQKSIFNRLKKLL